MQPAPKEGDGSVLFDNLSMPGIENYLCTLSNKKHIYITLYLFYGHMTVSASKDYVEIAPGIVWSIFWIAGLCIHTIQK